MGNFLIRLSGAHPEILDHCPTERIKFQSLGWAILITCTLATVSMWFALTSALGFSAALSLPVALIWGLVIMGIDRWLVTSMPGDGSRKLLMAMPRVVLALLLGSLISTPIVLRIFESEINNEITVIQAQNENTFLNSQQHGALVAQISQWTKTVANLDRVIATNGAVQIDPQSDPEWQTLNKQRAQELTLQAGYYKEWQCQLYGIYRGVKCPKGNGPLAQASENSYNQAVQQVSDLSAQMHDRVLALQASDEHSQQLRLQQAKNQLPPAQAHLTAATTENDAETSRFTSTNSKSSGILVRLQALDQLSGSNPTLNSARILLFLLFLVIECLPVSVKLLQRPGNYEKILQIATRRELSGAQRAFRDDPAFQQAGQEDIFDISDIKGSRTDPRVARMASILRNGPTKLTTSPGWEETSKTDDFRQNDQDDPASSGSDHDPLHRVANPRGTTGFTQARGAAGKSGMNGHAGGNGPDHQFGDYDADEY